MNNDPRFGAIAAARSHNPFEFLGWHADSGSHVVRAFDPHALELEILGVGPMEKTDPRGLFEWRGNLPPELPYRLRADYGQGRNEWFDPYCFPATISEQELYLFNEGKLLESYRTLGSQPMRINGVEGVRFAVWAPNAERVSVVGDFNQWDGRRHSMRSRGASGVWELFVPGLPAGTLYKYEIRQRGSGHLLLKTDPYARWFERRPGTAARVPTNVAYGWNDAAWLQNRAQWDWQHAPISIYEVHAGAWKRHPDGRFYSYDELSEHLIPYVQQCGYTHIELLPITEHPLDESWGYQTSGYFAPTSRYGNPDDLKTFIDRCHVAGIGVILDWVPAHFPQDAWALAHFDGTSLYEHDDPRLGYHHDWGTYIFNYGRSEVKSFLLSSAHYWLSEFHADGLRVDAVASMLYLDYSRKEGEWLPNKYGGRENLEAIEFLRELNIMVHGHFHGALTFAEESTAWPMVSRPAYLGGLGFSVKWNMGWMNDTLRYMLNDPVHRRWHHNLLTFGQLYAYTENFVLPFSHDEVVHGKGSMLSKMPGDAWQKFANLRLLYTYQMTTPGKKLNFMGDEFAQGREWNSGWELDWNQCTIDWHAGTLRLTEDLNRFYRSEPALHDLDFDSAGFQWLDCNDAEQSILSYLRRDREGRFVVVVLNFTPVLRTGFRVGVPQAGRYIEVLNSDAQRYCGSNQRNGVLEAEATPWMGQEWSLALTLPPLAGIVLSLQA